MTPPTQQYLPPMQLIINSRPHSFEQQLTLTELLEQLGLASHPVVVEINHVAIARSDFSRTILKHGDQLEILTLFSGG